MTELFLEILNRSISATWLVLIIVAVRFLLKKAPKWMDVVLWGLVALRLVCPFSLESTLSLIPSAETVPQEILLSPTPQINTGIAAVNRSINPILAEQFSPEPVASANPLQILIPILAFVWCVGMAGMALYTFVSYWKLRRRVRTAIHVSEELYLSEFVSTPFVLGLFRPRIYLPYHMKEQDSHYVVAHERTHIRRKDYWWKPLGFLLLTVNWFNPLMWLAYILLCRDIELACDEKVIRDMGPGQRADYSQALLNCSVSRRSIAACPLAFGEVGVKDRVVNVLNYKKPTFWVILICVILIVLIAVCFLTNPKTTLPFMNNYTPVLQAEVFDSRSGETVSRVLTMDEREELSYRLRDMDGLQERSAPTGSGTQYSLTAELMDLGSVYVRCSSEQEFLLQFQEKHYLVTDPDFVEYLDTVCAGKHIAKAEEPNPFSVTASLTSDGLSGYAKFQSGGGYAFYDNMTQSLVSMLNRLEETDFVPSPGITPRTVVTLSSDTLKITLTSDGETVEFGFDTKTPLDNTSWAVRNAALNAFFSSLNQYTYLDEALEAQNQLPLEDLPQNYTPEQAAADHCVVLIDGDVQANPEVWNTFVSDASRGPASVRVMTYDSPSSTETNASRVFDLSYNGNSYTLRWFENGQQIVKNYRYLRYFSGLAEDPNASYDEYKRYILTDNGTATYEELWQSLLSSQSGMAIDFFEIYTDLITYPQLADIPALASVQLCLDGQTLITVLDDANVRAIRELIVNAQQTYEPKTYSLGPELVLTCQDGKQITAALDMLNDLCVIDGTFFDYGPGYTEEGSIRAIPQLLSLLGLTDWPQAVYEKYSR